jgi:hypothetical protein
LCSTTLVELFIYLLVLLEWKTGIHREKPLTRHWQSRWIVSSTQTGVEIRTLMEYELISERVFVYWHILKIKSFNS